MENRGRLLYLSTVGAGPYQGVLKKIAMQCDAFEKIGLDVVHINSGEKTVCGQLAKILPFSYGVNYRIIKKRLINLQCRDYQYCYIRYSPASRGLIDVLKTLKRINNQIKIILEIPTYPYEDELKTIKSIPFKIRDRLYRNKMKNYVDLVITPSYVENDEIYGIPALEITNGIDVDRIKVREPRKREKEKIILLGVALITAKQGYDRVIRGLSEYLQTKNTNEPDVVFYVIGTGNAKNDLKILSEKLSLKDNVFFVGEKENEQLEFYYNLADLGIGTLGQYKTNELKRANSLKTREYCAKGLPFIITDCDYMFADSNFEFCLVIGNDDTPVNIREAIHFISECRKAFTDEEILEHMNRFAKENLSWSKILDSVIRKVSS